MPANFPNKVYHGGKTSRAHTPDTDAAMIDVSASINPFAPAVDCTFSPEDIAEYPDDSYLDLKTAIGKVFGRPVEEICVGNGSAELIRVYCQVTAGKTCRIDMPTFGEYGLSAELAGKRAVAYPEPADIRFICNPNNPTGTIIERDEMQYIIDDAQRNGQQLFVDEAFMALAETDESVADIRTDNLFVLRSLTKSYAVPGLRFGFGFGPADLIERIETARTPWTVNGFAEKYAVAALEKYPLLRKSAEKITREREWLFDELEKRRLPYFAAKANYVCFNVGQPAADVAEKMRQEGFYVRDCTSFGLPENIRVAIETHDINRRVMEALDSCLH
ncbi:MAG TPA: histidinol-phosphate transaminase [Methanocorpusculum sp.]|nr:histidinol-phosphate transaminase [Methanocorpusculum sp.]